MSDNRRSHLVPVLQALVVTFLWSTSWVLIKFGLEEIPALTFAGLRYSFAALVLILVALSSTEIRRSVMALSAAKWMQLIALGLVFYTLTQGAMFVALEHVPAISLTLILSFTPAAVALMAIPWLGERPRRIQWIGIATFLAGVMIYFAPAGMSLQRIGLMAGLTCLVANAISTLMGRQINRALELHPLVVTVVSMGFGSAGLLAVGSSMQGLPPLSPRSWAIIGWLAVVNTAFAFTLWNHTLRRLTAVESSIINNTMTVQIAILAWLFLGESVDLRGLLGLTLAVVGAVLVQLPQRGSRNESGS
ncbi:MAG: DMT family transporter [Acidobacteriota bacterium]